MRNQIALETDRPVSIRPSRRSHTLIYMLETSTAGTSTGVISWPWEPGLLGSSQQPWTAEWPKGNSQFLLSPMERRHQFGPGLREFRPGQPTAGQTCPRKHPAVTTLAFPTPPRDKVPAHSDPVKRWNFRKADWTRFCLLTDECVRDCHLRTQQTSRKRVRN